MLPAIEPTKEAVEAARAALRELRDVHADARVISIRSPEGEEIGVTLPGEAFAALVEVLDQLAKGASVRIVPQYEEVTTQEAADLLKVSRPFLIRLLESGEIPFRKTGSHRRVRVQDLLAYRDRDDAERRSVADELAAEAQKHGLGY